MRILLQQTVAVIRFLITEVHVRREPDGIDAEIGAVIQPSGNAGGVPGKIHGVSVSLSVISRTGALATKRLFD